MKMRGPPPCKVLYQSEHQKGGKKRENRVIKNFLHILMGSTACVMHNLKRENRVIKKLLC